MAEYSSEFFKRGVKLLGMSCDDLQPDNEWIKDIEAYTQDAKVNYPIVDDPKREFIKQLNMDEVVRLIKIKPSFLYPATTGRNMDEVVRVFDSLQKASKFKVATPANWKQGDLVVISPGVTNVQAKDMFPQGFETVDLPSKKEYLRYTKI